MDFARKQLEKYGWTDGKGLGKHENGISEPIKPKLKRSVAGIGHDQAAEHTDQWWNKLYDKAAKNVEVEEKNGKTKKIKTKDDKFQITNSSYHLNKTDSNQDEEYSDFFIKKAVLTNDGGGEQKLRESESEEEIEEDGKKDVFKMTDEELFAACEGRTAHKGARHGLRANGKLARIQRQEQMLLTQPKYTGYSHTKKHKKDTLQMDLEVMETTNLNDDSSADSSQIKKKKKKRKRCFSDDRLPANFAESVLQPVPEEKDTEIAGNDVPMSSSKSKRKSEDNKNLENEMVSESKKKKKQVQSDEVIEMEIAESAKTEFDKHEVKKNKKKKKKEQEL